MATGPDLKGIAQARLRTAEVLMDAGDWEGAAYMLPYALECALKAVICKTLHLSVYPDSEKNEKDGTVRGFFTTHVFVQLLVISGLQDIFSPNGQDIPYRYWSDFAIEYPGKWVGMRYEPERMAQFDETKVRALHQKLVDADHGILTLIEQGARW